MTNKTFLTTRPTLASFLIERGYQYRVTANPFTPGLHAWEFPITADLVSDTDSYYREIGKPLPRVLATYGKEGKEQ